MPDLRLSANIGEQGSDNDVENHSNLPVTATIRTSTDLREYSAQNGNLSSCTLIISKSQTVSLVDKSTQTVVDITKGQTEADNTSVMGFDMTVRNDSGDNITNAVLVSHTPVKSDDMTGIVSVTSFSIDPETSAAHDHMLIYYTTASEALTRDNYKFADITEGNGWTYVGDKTADLSGISGITAIAVVTDILNNQSVKMHTDITVNNPTPGDALEHVLTFKNSDDGKALLSSARSYIISRSITGIVWKDIDHDGIRHHNEPVYPGITVKLYKLKSSDTSSSPASAGLMSAMSGSLTGVLLNTVFRDRSDDVAAIAGRIAALGVSLDDYSKYDMDTVVDSTVTDENGNYRFDDMSAVPTL